MTAQIGERLILDGKPTSMAFCPTLPENHPRITEVSLEEARQDDENAILFSTACWRGYQGTWQIADGRFYLVGLRGRWRLSGDEPLLADWFSGVLRIPQGQMLHYVHMGYGSVYEQEIHIRIEKGAVVASRIKDNRGDKHDPIALGWENLPGSENRFPGDDEV